LKLPPYLVNGFQEVLQSGSTHSFRLDFHGSGAYWGEQIRGRVTAKLSEIILKKESPLADTIVALIKKPLQEQLKVRLTNCTNLPIPNEITTFTLTQPNGSNGKLRDPLTGQEGTSINVLTNISTGISSIEMTVGSKEGIYVVQATYASLPNQPISFMISGVEGHLELEIDKDPAVYLPIKDDLIIVKANIINKNGNLVPNIRGRLVFELLRFQEDEFSWSDGMRAGPIVVNIDPSGVTYPSNSPPTPVMVMSKAYWGSAKVHVYGHPNDNIGLVEVEDKTTKQILIDEDGDGIADSWENSNGLNPHNRRDRNEDNERVQGIHEVGDGFTAWNEYKGYKLSGIHYRMNPQEKEVFVNRYDAPGIGTYAIGYVRSIGISVIESNERPDFQGKATPPKPAEAINLMNRTTASATDNGIQYLDDGTPTGYSKFTLGQTQGINAQGDVDIFLTTINNYFDLNKIRESTILPQPIIYPNSDGDWRKAIFNGTDINGDGDTDDFINVFDWGDEVLDGKIEGMSKNELMERVPLHEIGHTFGLNEAPIGTFSVMRQGVTSQNIGIFTRSETRDIRVWTWGR
jgi:hypothetical protein